LKLEYKKWQHGTLQKLASALAFSHWVFLRLVILDKWIVIIFVSFPKYLLFQLIHGKINLFNYISRFRFLRTGLGEQKNWEWNTGNSYAPSPFLLWPAHACTQQLKDTQVILGILCCLWDSMKLFIKWYSGRSINYK
jgi:hypothetical protein